MDYQAKGPNGQGPGTSNNGVLTSALAYARRGWSVFPAPPGKKKSYKSAKHSNGQAWGKTDDPDQVKKDWEKWPDANIGIVTGKESGIWVMEADTKEGHGVDGLGSVVELERQHGGLPETLMAESPSGSIHYYFKHPGGDIKIKNSASEIAPGVDVRGDGGMVIAPPSVRKDGSYRWLNSLEPSEAPAWLIAVATEKTKKRKKSGGDQPGDLERLRAALEVIPNDGLGWEEWNNVGMAIFSATGGSDEGLKLFHEWSEKCKEKYDKDKTDEKWEALHKTPPTSIGAGTIFYLANEARPGWDSGLVPIVKFGALSKMADRAAEVLIEAKVPFYQRGDKMVRPVILPVDTFDGKTTTTAQLVEVDLHYMRDMLCRKSRWVKFDMRSQSWVDIHPPKDPALILLGRYGDWNFPSIAGIISTPTLRPDGTILSEAGYDTSTRLLLVDPPPMPAINEKPTKEEAQAALDLLKALLSEFPFADTTADNKSVSRAVALSAYLTTVCRAAFPVAPMHIGDAPVASSGKSYLLSTVAAIITGQSMPVITAGKSEEEMEKRLGAAVIKGQSLICLDNLTGELGGDALCQLVEQQRPSVRVLGLSKNVEVEARSVTFFANGNNIVIVGDLCRRVVRFRLDPKMEKPELRTFNGNPMQDILADRGRYIAACLTICRAYIAAGRPNKMPQLASFNEWSDTVRSALVWLGEEDPVKSMDTSRAEDPVKTTLLTMLTEWKAAFGTGEQNGKATLKDVIDRCNRVRSFDPVTKATVYEHPELRNAVMACTPRRQLDVDALGYWMRGNKERIIDGMCFDRKPGSSGGATVWWVKEIVSKGPGTEDIM